MRYILFTLAICFSASVSAQAKFNLVLKRQLDSVNVLDQKYREILTKLTDPTVASQVAKPYKMSPTQLMNNLWKKQSKLDSSNIVFVEAVIKKHGYPGKTLVGTETSTAAWNVIQHSPDIAKYLDVMKTAAEKGELPFDKYATMLDRFLLNRNQEQIYGTQCSCQTIKQVKEGCFVWPIKDEPHVNDRRKAAGFTSTVEQNATRLGVVYQVVKLQDVLPTPKPWYKTTF